MKKLKSVLFAAAALSLTACQMDMRSNNSAGLIATKKFAATVHKSFPNVRAVAGTTRNLASNPFGGTIPGTTSWQQWPGQWQNTASQGVYGNYLMYPNMGDETQRCSQMVDAIPAKLQNLDFAVGTLERCLFRLAINRSAPMNYMWRNGGADITQYAGYINDYARPGQFGNYNYDMYNPFLLNGQNGYIYQTGSYNQNYYGY